MGRRPVFHPSFIDYRNDKPHYKIELNHALQDYFSGATEIRLFFFASISPYSFRMRENADQNNSEYGHYYAVMIFFSYYLFYGSLIQKILNKNSNHSMHLVQNCPNMQFFCSAFSRIWTKYRDLWSKSLYSVQIRKNTDQKNSASRDSSRSVVSF